MGCTISPLLDQTLATGIYPSPLEASLRKSLQGEHFLIKKKKADFIMPQDTFMSSHLPKSLEPAFTYLLRIYTPIHSLSLSLNIYVISIYTHTHTLYIHIYIYGYTHIHTPIHSLSLYICISHTYIISLYIHTHIYVYTYIYTHLYILYFLRNYLFESKVRVINPTLY